MTNIPRYFKSYERGRSNWELQPRLLRWNLHMDTRVRLYFHISESDSQLYLENVRLTGQKRINVKSFDWSAWQYFSTLTGRYPASITSLWWWSPRLLPKACLEHDVVGGLWTMLWHGVKTHKMWFFICSAMVRGIPYISENKSTKNRYTLKYQGDKMFIPIVL